MLTNSESAGPVGFYVYGLYDPREAEPFYIGKGCGARWKQTLSDRHNKAKKRKIDEILASGLTIECDIAFDGLDERMAFVIEGVLINRFKNLTNILTPRYGSTERKEFLEFMRNSDTMEPVIS